MKRTLQTIIPLIAIFFFTSCFNLQLKDNKAYINGTLGKKSHKKIMKFIDENPNIKTFVLVYIPGSANDKYNVKTCLEINKRGINTELLSHSIIESDELICLFQGIKEQ